jgi:ferritin-like metal-binding protein YciE
VPEKKISQETVRPLLLILKILGVTMKNNQDLYQLFLDELEDLYSAEKQIQIALPNIIKLTSNASLKEALINNLKQSKNHLDRIKQIFLSLNEQLKEATCEAVKGLIADINLFVKNKSNSPFLDAAIICAIQKIAHYEIATYGTLHSFAKHLNFNGDIIDAILETLDEEGTLNKKLTKIADGSLFEKGVNQEAVGAAGAHGHERF